VDARSKRRRQTLESLATFEPSRRWREADSTAATTVLLLTCALGRGHTAGVHGCDALSG